MEPAAACSECGSTFVGTEPRAACCKCGSTRRTFQGQVNLVATAELSFGLRQKQPGTPGWLVTIIDRVKTSLHGRRAKEVLMLDRSTPDKTVKSHRVQEQQDDGSWKTVHEHREEFPAKRRGTPRSDL